MSGLLLVLVACFAACVGILAIIFLIVPVLKGVGWLIGGLFSGIAWLVTHVSSSSRACSPTP